MRAAAHRMVGEPLADEVRRIAARVADAPLARRIGMVRTSQDPDSLRARAVVAVDPRERIAALRELALRFRDREALVGRALDPDETAKVRKQAARFVGWTGPGADDALVALMDARHPPCVRAGAVLGFGESGSAEATGRLLARAPEVHAVRALARVRNPAAARPLRTALREGRGTDATRRAICRALARMPGPATTTALVDVLRDDDADPALRAGAAEALGMLGDASALPVLLVARNDAQPSVRRPARVAAARLGRAR
jgi:HEAT repeat protein